LADCDWKKELSVSQNDRVSDVLDVLLGGSDEEVEVEVAGAEELVTI
jgi:hypothetical protein